MATEKVDWQSLIHLRVLVRVMREKESRGSREWSLVVEGRVMEVSASGTYVKLLEDGAGRAQWYSSDELTFVDQVPSVEGGG
jgi:hypothetical protein